jgi:hypothetical protein
MTTSADRFAQPPKETDIEVRFVGEMQRLEIGPGDRFVLTTEQAISQEIAERLQAAWTAFAGEGVKLLILDRDMKLGAINVNVERAARRVRG